MYLAPANCSFLPLVDQFFEGLKNALPDINEEEALVYLRCHNYDMDLALYSYVLESDEFYDAWEGKNAVSMTLSKCSGVEISKLRAKKYKIKRYTRI